MVGSEYGKRMRNGVDCRKERSVKPSTTLRDKLVETIRYIGFGIRRLHVMQSPGSLSLRHEFKTQNSILGKVHIRLENSSTGTMELFTLEVRGQWTLPQVIVLQRDITIRGERTWQDGNKPKDTFEGFIEDVRHFVLKILSRNKRIEKVPPEWSLHCDDFSASTGNVGI